MPLNTAGGFTKETRAKIDYELLSEDYRQLQLDLGKKDEDLRSLRATIEPFLEGKVELDEGMDYKESEWGLLVANADLQIAAGTCPLIEDEAIVWANNRIKRLEKKLTEGRAEAQLLQGVYLEGLDNLSLSKMALRYSTTMPESQAADLMQVIGLRIGGMRRIDGR